VTVYGQDYYGYDPNGQLVYYGLQTTATLPQIPPGYLVDPFSATAINYSQIMLAWTEPTATTWIDFRVLRNRYGFPVDENDGMILEDSGTIYPGNSLIDTDVIAGTYHYYGIYILVQVGPSQIWYRAGLAACLAPVDFGSATWLLNRIPEFWKTTNDQDLTTDAVGNQYFLQYISIFGWMIDYLKTALQVAENVNDPAVIPLNYLYNLAGTLGFPFEPEISAGIIRNAVANQAELVHERGTLEGIAGYITQLTGWPVDIQIGPNIMLEQDQSRFVDPASTAWNINLSYDSGEYVTYGQYVYISNTSGNLGNVPSGTSSNTTFWNALYYTQISNVLVNPVTGWQNTWEPRWTSASNQVASAGALTEIVGIMNRTSTSIFQKNGLAIENGFGSTTTLDLQSISRSEADIGTTLSITATQEGVGTNTGMLMRVKVLTGANLHAFGNTATANLDTAANPQIVMSNTVVSSQIYQVYLTTQSATAYTALAGTTFTDNVADTTNTLYYGTARTTSATSTPGVLTLGSSTPMSPISGNACALEILPNGTITESGTAPAVADTFVGTAVTSAVFTPPQGSLLVVMIAADASNAGVNEIQVTDTLGLIWTQNVVLSVQNQGYVGIWTAFVPESPALATANRHQVIGDGIPVPFSLNAWSAATHYGTGTIVQYNSQSFIALKASTGITPPVNNVGNNEWAPIGYDQRIALMLSGYASNTAAESLQYHMQPYVAWYDQTGTYITTLYPRSQSAQYADVTLATAAALPTVTGTGATTLTATANGVLTVDGVATVLNNTILVQNQASGAQNGFYQVTTQGTASVAFVLTRLATPTAAQYVGAYVTAQLGTANGQLTFYCTNTTTPTFGTTAIAFQQTPMPWAFYPGSIMFQSFAESTWWGDALATSGMPDLGNYTWTAQASSFNISAFDGGSVTPSAANTRTYATIPYGSANCQLGVTIAALASTGYSLGLVARWASDTSYWRIDQTAIVLVSAGPTHTVEATHSVAFSAGDRMTVTLNGNAITVYRNGTQVSTVTNATNNSATVHGIIVETN
jgi:phage tail-like protein